MRLLRHPSAPVADAPALSLVVGPTVLAPGLQADELTGLVELVEIADPDAVAAAEIAAEVEAELALDLAASALDAEIAQAESLVEELAGEVRDSASAPASLGADDALVLAARSGDDAALTQLLTKYRAFARVKARSYFLVGADREDIVQEGMIGLYKAIRDFNPELQTSFRAFAELCVTRQIITAIKTATRQKHGPLNNYVSFHRPLSGEDDGGERTLADVLPTVAISDPAELVISAERIRALQLHFDEVLSDLETEVLRLYVEGKSYQEIAERLQRHVKTIDNALQRIKKKLEGHLRARSAADAG
ncbi:MAG: polymerase sigma-H factor [Frankiales bacterium]|nr:polymerase sigma-H factor [Frankiales bacterium]